MAEHTAEHERGRAYAAHFALTHACWLITYWAVGQSSSMWGPATTFTAAGALCLVVSFIAWMMGRGVATAHSHGLSGRTDEETA